MNHSLYRAYHAPSGTFLANGALSLNNMFYVFPPNAEPVKMEGVEIDLCTGQVTESGQPVYQNDIVEVATPNEFGSATIRTGTVRYDMHLMAYVIISPEQPAEARALPTKILRVIGHNHDR